jgi:hypothetical protein
MSITTPAPKVPSAYQLEQAVSLWMQLRQVPDDDFEVDENEIERLIREAGHRTPAEMLATLIDAAVMLDQKVDFFDGLRKRYAEKKARYAERLERTRATVVQLMEVLETPAAEGSLGSAGFVKPSKHVVILELAKLPEKFVTRPDPVPDKIAIRNAIKTGEAVPGAEYSAGNEPPTIRITPY